MVGQGAYQRKARNILNVRARHDLLLRGIQAPTTVDKTINAALIGQRAFAALDLPRLKITPLALNTIKSLSDELFTEPDAEGRKGFEYLNTLRVRLNAALSGVAVARTAAAKTERVETKTQQLMARLNASGKQSVKRQRAYLSLYAGLNGLIKHGSLPVEVQQRLYWLLENHHAAFADLFESNTDVATGGDSQVTQLIKELKRPQ